MLQRLLAGTNVSVRVKRKALSLLMDLSHVTQPQGQQLRLATHQGRGRGWWAWDLGRF